MSGFTDYHAHFVYGVDDGARTREEMFAMLDAAARRIVKLSAPFPPFPPDIAKDTDILEITRTWIFTNDQLATRSAAGPKP